MKDNVKVIKILESSFDREDDIEKIKNDVSSTKYWQIGINDFLDFTLTLKNQLYFDIPVFNNEDAFRELDTLRKYFSDYTIVLEENRDLDNFLYIFQINNKVSKLFVFNIDFGESPIIHEIEHNI